MTELLPASPAEIDEVFAFQLACDRAEFGEEDSSREDMEELWSEIIPEKDAWLARDANGGLIGYACVSGMANGLQLDIYIHPLTSPVGLEEELLRACEARAREILQNEKAESRRILTGYASRSNPRLQAMFEKSGFVRHTTHYRMQIDLESACAAVVWPEGYTPAPYQPEHETALYELIEAAFAREDRVQPSMALWRSLVFRGGRFDPGLFVLVHQEQELVGAALAYDEDGSGWIRQLAVRPGLQGQGLGGLLLRHMFYMFWQRGIARVALGVAARNQVAVRFYERAGMQRIREYIEFRKNL